MYRMFIKQGVYIYSYLTVSPSGQTQLYSEGPVYILHTTEIIGEPASLTLCGVCGCVHVRAVHLLELGLPPPLSILGGLLRPPSGGAAVHHYELGNIVFCFLASRLMFRRVPNTYHFTRAFDFLVQGFNSQI